MAAQATWDALYALEPSDDEEAAGALLPPQPVLARGRKIPLSVLLSGVIVAVGLLVTVGKYSRGTDSNTLIASLPHLDAVLQEAEVLQGGPSAALKKEALRSKTLVEGDLKASLLDHVNMRGVSRDWWPEGDAGTEVCQYKAGQLFDSFVRAEGIDRELEVLEKVAWRERYTSSMATSCKGTQSEIAWLEIAGKELEQQKPVMTKAFAASLDGAGLGFKATMKDWMMHESVSMYAARLGVLPTPPGEKSVFKSGRHARRNNVTMPLSFQAEDKWPECKDAILRIHNQGHCGSCWVFGSVAAIDSRLCIASGGVFNGQFDVLSRLQGTSCAAEAMQPGWDGCEGGFPTWVMEYVGSVGLVSTNCMPYYITGEGVEHFDHREAAPPCELQTHCQGGYDMGWQQDTFHIPGVANYDNIVPFHGDEEAFMRLKLAIYEEGPVAYAFLANGPFMSYSGGIFSVCQPEDQANHAVYASGWGQIDGVPYVQSSNSWGEDWGVGGRFLIHPNCIYMVTIPGTITNPQLHTVKDVDLSIPRDPSNINWPWKPDDICPFDNGCVQDMERDGYYSPSEKCVSHALDGKKVKVVEFALEYGYDFLRANGHTYTGVETGFALSGSVIDENGIVFETDSSIEMAGFKICEDVDDV